MSNFGRNGRLGNQLFQYAAMFGFSKIVNTDVVLSSRNLSHFNADYSIGVPKGVLIKESQFTFDESLGEKIAFTHRRHGNVDLNGYFQSKKYWEHCEEELKNSLQFHDEFAAECRLGMLEAFKKRTIAIHIRRGDYIDNPNHYLLPINYYYFALDKYLYGWRNCNVIIFSDDIEYCKIHFKCLDNVFFSEGRNEIEDLCLMSQCDDFVISNSSYSWWGAYLSSTKDKVIVRPTDHFSGTLKETASIIDFYPEEWIAFDHEKSRIDLEDVTFTIPVQYDHRDRIKNLELSVCMLQHYFNTNIIVMENVPENSTPSFEFISEHATYLTSSHKEFHRTKMLNDMAKYAKTPIIVNWDADVIISPLQIFEAVVKIRNKKADMVFPYDGTFARLPREIWFKEISKRLDIGFLRNARLKGMEKDATVSVGGAVLFRKESFIRGGMENENFISFGPEDVERNIRFKTLGFNVDRIKGALYHMNHFVGQNSSNRHKHVQNNRAEFHKIDGMNKKDLQTYIKTWPWLINSTEEN